MTLAVFVLGVLVALGVFLHIVHDSRYDKDAERIAAAIIVVILAIGTFSYFHSKPQPVQRVERHAVRHR